MSQRYLGGVITANPTTPTTASASGVWTLEQQFQYLQGVQAKKIGNSVRLRSSASAYFNRTPASASNQQKWTWSGWVKRGVLGSGYQELFGARTGSSGTYALFWFYNDTLTFQTSATSNITTTSVYRDPSAWYHVVLSVDTAQATAANRTLLYVNGTQVTAFSTATYPTQNSNLNVNSTAAHFIGQQNSSEYFDGYMAEVNFVDGQALTPSSFGAFDGNGVWQPLSYAGTYGTNGFYLTFADNSAATATTLGKDYSGNGNNWTPNNISVTAGVTYDWMLDSPSNYANASTGVGNYCVLNPLKRSQSSATVDNANLRFVGVSGSYVDSVYGTIGVTGSGKYYYEVNGAYIVGFNNSDVNPTIDQTTGRVTYHASAGLIQVGATTVQSGLPTAYNNTDVVGVALNLDAGTIAFYKNNTQVGTSVSISSASTWWPFFENTTTYYTQPNFGQRPFAYTPPTGFVALNTQNLPAVNINNGAQYMAATTYTGTGAALAVSNGANNPIGTTFQPDLVWGKCRSAGSTSNWLENSITGAGYILYSDQTVAEQNNTAYATSFNSNGFSVAGNTSYFNASGSTYVGWQWKAAGSSVSNTNGSITSTVNAGTTQGFSVVTYTGNATSGATVGHGLGVAPAMTIVKRRDTTAYWAVWHKNLTNYAYELYLNTTDAQALDNSFTAAPSSTVLTLGSGAINNASGGTYVAYCFAEVAGYSKFGSYTGNGSADGPFVYLGFKPRFVLIKQTSGLSDWWIWDTSRETYNQMSSPLYPDTSAAETSNAVFNFDILSNGFKMRSTNATVNGSGLNYIYAAFAENPFNIARAR